MQDKNFAYTFIRYLFHLIKRKFLQISDGLNYKNNDFLDFLVWCLLVEEVWMQCKNSRLVYLDVC